MFLATQRQRESALKTELDALRLPSDDDEAGLEQQLLEVQVKLAKARATRNGAKPRNTRMSSDELLVTAPRNTRMSSDELLGERAGQRARSHSPTRFAVSNKWAALQESRPF